MKVEIGKTVEGRKSVSVDLDALIASRMLVQAASGAGKSYLLRKLIEQAAPHVHTLVVDCEGEFHTLREKLDMVLIGRGGELPADNKSIGRIGSLLVRDRISAICDCSELKHADRFGFVKKLIAAVMQVGQRHWHPMLVVVDEAHLFCPERGKGRSESTDAVIDLMTRGRKRGFSGVLATQRLSKLNKDAAAECGNVLIGRTSPVDLDRAADLMGLPSKEKRCFVPLDDGEFFATGPALGKGVLRFLGAKVATTHPKAGGGQAIEPPARARADKLKRIAEQVREAARAGADEVADLEEAKTEIKRLRREIARAANTDAQASAKVQTVVDEAAIDRAVSRALNQQARTQARREKQYRKALDTYGGRLKKIGQIAAQNGVAIPDEPDPLPSGRGSGSADPRPVAQPPARPTPASPARVSTAKIGGGAKRRMLMALAQYGKPMTANHLGLAAEVRPNAGHFNNCVGELRREGLIDGTNTGFSITELGIEEAGDFEPLPTGQALIDYWIGQLGGGLRRRIFEAIVEAYPDEMTRPELAAAVGTTECGHFNNCLGELRTRCLIERKRIRAADELFDE